MKNMQNSCEANFSNTMDNVQLETTYNIILSCERPLHIHLLYLSCLYKSTIHSWDPSVSKTIFRYFVLFILYVNSTQRAQQWNEAIQRKLLSPWMKRVRINAKIICTDFFHTHTQPFQYISRCPQTKSQYIVDGHFCSFIFTNTYICDNRVLRKPFFDN